MNKIAVNPNTNVAFCAVWGGGVYRSTDKGLTWTKSDAGLSEPFVNDLLFDKNGEGYAATQGGGVYRSTDNGTSWSAASTGLTNKNITTLAFGPGNMLLAGSYGSGVFMSTNKGANWTNSRKNLKYQDVKTIATAQNGYILAGTYGGGIFMSRDTGRTWTANNSGLNNKFINQIIVAANSLMYAATNGDGVYFSGNHGTSWSPYDTATIGDKYVTCLTINGQREVVAGTRSRGVHYNDQNVWFRWRQATAFDQGVGSITCDNTGYVLYTDLWNSSNYSDDHARTFKSGGKVIEIPSQYAIGAFKNGLIYAKYNASPIRRSTDYGATWSSLGLDTMNVNCFALDSAGTVYIGTVNGMMYSTNSGANWLPVPFLNGRVVNDVEISPQQAIFVTTIKIFQGEPPPPPEFKIFKSLNKIDWTEIRTSQNKPFSNLSFARTGELVVAFGDSAVDISRDQGQVWEMIADFPEPVSEVRFSASNRLWIGGGKKMYHTADFGQNWQSTTLGYPQNRSFSIMNFAVGPEGYVYAITRIFDGFNTRYDVRRSEDFIHWDSLSTGINMGEYKEIESDAEGNIFIARNNILKIIDRHFLGVPAWIYPRQSFEGIDTAMTFKWNSGRLAELYEMQYSQADDFSNIDEWVVTSDTTFTPAYPLILGKNYYARVRSRVNDQYSPWNTMSFMTKLGGPILISPAKDSTGVSFLAELKWEPVSEADYYSVEVSTKSNFTAIVFAQDSTTQTSVTTTALTPNTQYFWRVKARTKTNSSEWSEVWNFRTTLLAPTLVSPTNNSRGLDRSVVLKWNKVVDAPSYDIEVSTSPEFTAAEIVKSDIADTTVIVDGLSYDTKYFWRVRAGVEPAISAWSNAWNFTTGIEPPTLVSPADKAAGLPPNLTLTWEFAPAGSYTYEIQIDTSLAFSGAPRATAAKTYDTTGLRLSSKYFWRARAVKGSQKGFWSEAWSFT
ncbi:MAG: fibronectin type III domain-containing protein, partial [Chloroflexota bacterium]